MSREEQVSVRAADSEILSYLFKLELEVGCIACGLKSEVTLSK